MAKAKMKPAKTKFKQEFQNPVVKKHTDKPTLKSATKLRPDRQKGYKKKLTTDLD